MAEPEDDTVDDAPELINASAESDSGEWEKLDDSAVVGKAAVEVILSVVDSI